MIRSEGHLIVIKAKNADMEKGFTRLAVELIAMDKSVQEDQESILYGAVTVGEVWRFASLNREEQLILKDLDVIAIPTDLEELFAVFLKILG